MVNNVKPVVRLSGQNGNVFMILGLCRQAAQKASWTEERIKWVLEEMQSKDYDHVIQTAFKYFEVQ
jgi:hypothetical protein